MLAYIFSSNVGSKVETSLRWGVGALQGSIVRSQMALMSQNSLLCNIVSVHRSVCLLCNIVLYKGAPNICWCWYLWICLKEGQVLLSRDQRLALFPAQIFTTIDIVVIIMIWNQILSNQSNTSFSMFTRSQEESRLEDCAANRWKIAIVYALVVCATVQCNSATDLLQCCQCNNAIVFAPVVRATVLQCNSLHTSCLCYSVFNT